MKTKRKRRRRGSGRIICANFRGFFRQFVSFCDFLLLDGGVEWQVSWLAAALQKDQERRLRKELHEKLFVVRHVGQVMLPAPL